MSKMGLHDPFESRIKVSIWLLPIKSWESPYNKCVQVVCYISLEISPQALQLCFRPHLNWRSTQEVMALQNVKSPNFGNFGTPKLRDPWQNNIWMQPLWLITKNTIRGKVVASPKFGPWWVLWIRVCLWLVCAPKVLQLCINQLVVWFV
jgi:hypothetical protein